MALLKSDEIEAIALKLSTLGIGLGRRLGGGLNASTFALKNTPAKVVKVFRSGAEELSTMTILGDLAPAVSWQGTVGLYTVAVVDRVEAGNVKEVSSLNSVDARSLLGLLQQLAATGFVHMDCNLSNLGWTPGRQPVVMDVGACQKRERMTDRDQKWAVTFQMGLLLETCPVDKLVKSELFQEFAAGVTSKRRKRYSLEDLSKKSKRDPVKHAFSQAILAGGADNPHVDLYVGTLLIASYLQHENRAGLRAPELVLSIQRQDAAWLEELDRALLYVV